MAAVLFAIARLLDPILAKFSVTPAIAVVTVFDELKTGRPFTVKAASCAAADCVMIVTDHSDFDYAVVARHARMVVDTRNAMPRGA